MSEPVVMRVGDRERHEVDDALRAALGDGVLTLTEYDERAARCWAARTRPELDEVVHDLPGCQPAAVLPAVPGQPGSHQVVAVMSESGLETPVREGQDVRATAVMGTAHVDLRREDLPRELTVRATAVMGEVKVRVPQGTTVHLSGGAVLGERKAKVGPPVQGGAVVHVVANAVMGTVTVDDKPRKGGLIPAATGVVPQRRGRGPTAASSTSPRSPEVHRGRRALARVAGSVVPVAVAATLGLGLLQVVTADDGAAVFGSRVVPVGDDRAEVGVLFGSVTVVVPDDARVRTTGFSVFGSVDCARACGTAGDLLVEVRSTGAFGSVEIVTESERADEDGD